MITKELCRLPDKDAVLKLLQPARNNDDVTPQIWIAGFQSSSIPQMKPAGEITLCRLVFMGMEQYLLAPSLNLIIAQRLMRKRCEQCKKSYEPDNAVLERLGIDKAKYSEIKLYKAQGCDNCAGTGYYGRVPVFEFLFIDAEIRKALFNNATEEQIREITRKKGYTTLLQSAAQKVVADLTTFEEAIRVTSAE